MKSTIATLLLASAFPLCAQAGDWTGAGQFGFAYASGNANSETFNAKLDVKKDDERWLYEGNLSALRAKGEVDVILADGTPGREDVTNANRWQVGGKVGYKYTERMYFFGSGRYDSDDFAPFESQWIVSAGVGYKFIDTETTRFTGEVGPGWRRTQPIDVLVIDPPPARLVEVDSEDEAILRGTLAYTHQITATTSIANQLLLESGSDNTFLQNELGLQVQINETFALKTGLQVRHNTEAPDGVDKTDTLLTTNIVVGF